MLTFSVEDPSEATGLAADPGLTAGDVPTCYFQLKSSAETEDQYYFLGMPASYFATFGARLVADGFTAQAATPSSTGDFQSFSKDGTSLAVIYYAPSADLATGYVMVMNV